jgi:hypothetical protein
MPDVRVRLSAEGVGDVIAAFQKISSEGARTKNAAGDIDKALGAIGRTIAALSVGAAVAGLANLVGKSIETVDAQVKMSQKIGISVQQLQVFDFAARRAHVGVEEMNTGLQKSTRFFFDLENGTQQAKDTITALFGNPDALKGLTDEKKLQAVIDRLAKMPASFNKAALAQRIFGRSGSELIPVLNELSSDKLSAVTAEAKRLGQVLSDDDVNALRQANEAMDDLKAQASGLATQFSAGLLPSLTEVTRGISNLVTGTGGGVKQLGEDVGVFITAFTIGAVKVFNVLDHLVAGFTAAVTYGIVLIQTRSLTDAKNAFESVMNAVDQRVKDRKKAIEQALQPHSGPASTATGLGGDAELNLEQQRRAAKDALALQLANIENARKIRQASLNKQEAESADAYSKGLKSLDRYYEDRLNIILNQTQAEIDAATNALEEITKTPLRPDETAESRQKQIDDLKTRAQIAEISRTQQIAKLTQDKGNDERALAEKLLDFEAKLGQLQGDRHAKEEAALQKEAAQFELLLKQQGAPDTGERVKQFLNVGQAKIEFDDLRTAGDTALGEIAAKQQQLQNQVADGTLFQTQADQQLIEFERQRLFQLQQIAQAALAAAEASGDPERIAQAGALSNEVAGLAISTNRAAQEMAKLKAGLEGAVGQGLQEFLGRGILEANSLGDAFRGLASSIVSSMQQVLASIIAAYIQQKLFGDLLKQQKAAGGGGGGGLFGFIGGLFGLGGPKKAGGGLVRGPGTATSDSIPARLSDMEYVVKASAVKQPGALQFLEAFNRMGTSVFRSPRGYFASGGLVTGDNLSTSPANLSTPSEGTLHLALDPGILVRHFEGRGDFARLIIKTTGDHRKAVKGALGS